MADISVTLTLDDRQYQTAIKRAENAANNLGKSTVSSFNKIQDSLSKTKNSVDSLSKSSATLANGFKALVAAIGVRELAQFADSVTMVKNRLQGISSSQKDVETQFKALAATSMATGASLNDLSDIYYKVQLNAKSLGTSQKDAMQITSNLGALMQAAGISAQAASGGLLQLSQALGSGKLQGEELNSILENLQPVAQALAKYLGVDVGALKSLAEQGKITSRDLKNALLSATDAAEALGKKTQKTISQSFETLSTASKVAWNNFEKNTQTGRTVAQSIDLIATKILDFSNNIDSMVETIKPLMTIIELLASVWIGGKLIKAFQLVGGFIASAIMAFRQFGASIKTVGIAVVGLGSYFGQILGHIKNFYTAFRTAGNSITASIGAVLPLAGRLMGLFGGGLLKVVQAAAQSFIYLGGVASKTFATIAAFFGLEWFGDKFTSELDKADEKLKTLQKTANDGLSSDVPKKTAKEISDAYAATLKPLQEANVEKIQSLQNDLKMIGVAEDYRDAQKAVLDIETERSKALEKLRDEYANINDPQSAEELAIKEGALNKVYDEQIGKINKITSEIVAKNQAERLGLLTEQYRISTTKEYHDLMRERISTLLPEEEKAYYDIEKAAQDALIAELEREAALRKIAPTDLPTDVYDKIYKAVYQNIDAKKQEAKATIDQRRQENFLNVEYQDTLKSLEDIKSVQKEIAYDILPWQQRVQQQLIDDAEKRAKAEIDAENTKRGLRGQNAMDLAEEKKYTDALVKNAKDVAAARVKSMQDTRTFAYGWKAAMQSYVEEAGNAAKKAGAIFEKMMSGMEDLIVNFVKTGKFEWKNFLAMMLEELLRAQIQAVFASMIGDMTGALKGSSGGGLLSGLLGGGGKESSGGILGSIVGGIGKLFGISGSSTDQFGANENGKITQDISGNGTQTQGGVLDSLWNGIKGIGGSIFGGLKDIGGSLLTGLDNVGSWLGDIGGNILDGLGSLSDVLGNLGSGALTGLSDLGSWIGSGLSGLGSLFAGFFATGGKIPEGQFGMVAEKGPEMVNGKLYTKPTLVAGPATVVPFDKQNPYGSSNVQGYMDKQNPYNKSITNNSTNPYGNNTDMSNWSVGNLLSLINSGKVKNNNGFITMNGESVATNLGRADTGRYSGSSGKIPPNIDESKKIADEWFSQMTGASAGAYQDLTEKLSEYKAQTEKIKTKKAKLSKDPYAIQSDVSSLVGNANSIKFELEDRGTLDLIKRAQFWNLMPEDNIANAPNGFYASWWLNDKLGGKPESKSKLPEALQNGMISGIFKDSGIKRYHEDDINAIFGINQYLDTLGQSADGTVDSAYKFRSDYETKLSEYHKKLAAIRKAQEEKANEGPGILSTILGAVGAMMGGWGGLAMSALSAGGKFSGLFAEGGNIPKGYWGIAGEAGPEVVQGPATITPFDKMNSGTNITYNINAVDAMSFKQMLAKDPSFVHGVVMQGAKGIPMR